MRGAQRYVVALVALAVPGAAATSIVARDVAAAPVRHESAFLGGEAAIARLGPWLPDVAALHGLGADELREMLLDDETLTVDRFGNLAYFEELPPEEAAAATATTDEPAGAPPMTGPEFQLASLPGADLTIYLDFDGHTTTGTTWNAQYGVDPIVSPPFDRNGDPDTWSSQELQIIRDAWAIVAEDYRPWQVNVTTVDPGPEALRRSGSGDAQWGVRVVVTKDTWASCGCGGHAYIGAFDDSQDEPVFVYNSSLTGVAEAASHEVGHALGLAHDGTSTKGYYTGHDGIGPGWAPIMGASYYEEVTQWSLQEYSDANNADGTANYGRGPDDVAVISDQSLRNPPLRVDDHGGPEAPTPLTGPTASVSGIVGTRDDVDAFSFSTSGGVVELDARGAAIGPNLDIAMVLLDEGGETVATSNPVDGLDASIAATLTAGSYVVTIDGAGVGNPFTSPPSGYTDYGSLGAYTLTAQFDVAQPPDTTAPSAPTDLDAVVTGGDVALTWAPNDEPDLDGYVVQRDSGQGFEDIAAPSDTTYTDPLRPDGDHSYRVLAVDGAGNRSVPSDPVVVTVESSRRTYASTETTSFGTVEGTADRTRAADGSSQTITEVASNGKPASRHDLLEHRWVLPASSGGHVLTVHAAVIDGGDADDGVRFEVSDDGVRWTPVATVPGGAAIAAEFDVGQRAGNLHVRVVDTDRSVGQYGLDRVAIDLLALDGDGVVVPAPDPTSVTASIVPSRSGAARGEQHGVVTVTVENDRGDPVAAEVRVRFGGDFDEVVEGATDGDGIVTLATTASARKPTFSVCVEAIAAPLPYVAGDESC